MTESAASMDEKFKNLEIHWKTSQKKNEELQGSNGVCSINFLLTFLLAIFFSKNIFLQSDMTRIETIIAEKNKGLEGTISGLEKDNDSCLKREENQKGQSLCLRWLPIRSR